MHAHSALTSREGRLPEPHRQGANPLGKLELESTRVLPGGIEVLADARAVDGLLREAAPAGAELELVQEVAAPPGVFSADDPVLRLGLEAFERALGVKPLLVRVGGTLPIFPALAAKGIPTIGTGFALRESNAHSPNERMRVEDLDRALAAAQELYRSLSRLG